MANPAFTVNVTPFDTSGYVEIMFTNATKGVGWYSWRIYRRVAGAAVNYTFLHEYLNDVASYAFQDFSAPANVEVEYAVIRAYVSGLNVLEESPTPETATPIGEHYWITCPTMGLKLPIVIADAFSDEFDEQVFRIIGRGRKVDRGTNYGVAGSLTVQLRDNTVGTAAEQLNALRTLKTTVQDLWLRTPFGETWKVSLGQLGITRVPGVGQREFTDVVVPYSEIALPAFIPSVEFPDEGTFMLDETGTGILDEDGSPILGD